MNLVIGRLSFEWDKYLLPNLPLFSSPSLHLLLLRLSSPFSSPIFIPGLPYNSSFPIFSLLPSILSFLFSLLVLFQKFPSSSTILNSYMLQIRTTYNRLQKIWFVIIWYNIWWVENSQTVFMERWKDIHVYDLSIEMVHIRAQWKNRIHVPGNYLGL